MTDSDRRKTLIDEYAAKIDTRIALARDCLRSVKALTARFVLDDKRAFRDLEKLETDGEELGLYSFAASEHFDAEELEGVFADHIEQLEEDKSNVSALIEEAEEADRDEDEDSDEDEDGGEEE